MPFEWFVCVRYLKAKRKQSFISLISVISVAGVMVGVMALIIVLGVMTGFTDGLREKILGINSHIVLQRSNTQMEEHEALRASVEEIPGVVAATPYIYAQTMVTSHSGGTGAMLRGVDPATVDTVLSLSKHLVEGKFSDLTTPPEGDRREVPGIILGKELAKQLRVAVEDRIRLMSTAGPLTPMGVLPKIQTCRVVGIFETGMYEYDSAMAYVSLHTAQEFMELDQAVDGLELKVTEIYQAQELARLIERTLGPGYIAKDWIKMNKNLFSALQLEKTALSIIVALVVLVAAFNIVSTLIMVVMEKNKDIAILKSMGATSTHIMKIFIYEGLVIGLSGTLLGIGGGLAACELLSRYKFIKLPDVYPLSTLPVKVLPLDVTMIAVAAIIITFVATLYPSWQASRVEPATALRYE